MSPSWIALISIWSAIIALTGCQPPDPAAAGNVREDLFLAAPKRSIPHSALPVSVTNEVGGDIVIITGSNEEVAPDATVTGAQASVEGARVEAQEHITLTNVVLANGMAQVQLIRQGEMNTKDSAALHVRVPSGANLNEVSTHAGNIGVYGPVENVTAVITDSGDIEVLGGTGNVNLLTESGSITIDLVPEGETITAKAQNGAIDIHAVKAQVSASTTKGDIRFVGTLRSGEPHSFTTTEGGNIVIALPAYPDGQSAAYRIHAQTSTQPIITDYPADRKDGKGPLAICGVIYSPGPYRYYIEQTPVRFGRLEISPSLTTTLHFTGTLTSEYYRFDTDQPQVSVFTPRSQAIHIYPAAELSQIAAGKMPVDAACEQALKIDPNQLSAVELNLRSTTGRIFVHHIDLQQ